MNIDRKRSVLLLLAFCISLVAASGAFAQQVRSAPDATGEVEALLQQSREQGLTYLSTKDENAKKSTKKSLESAEKIIKKASQDDPACEKCTVLLVNTYFYQSYFGFSKNYDECIKAATQGLGRFSANGRLTYFLGMAQYNSGRYSESTKTLGRFLISPTDAESAAMAKQVQQDSQTRFLAGWNWYANYYQSPAAMITQYNPQTYRNEAIFQVTRDWEMNLGSVGFAALTAQAAKFDDPEIRNYVENLVNRLTGRSPGSPFDYTVTLVNSAEVNAVTPPGHIVVYSGLLAFAENESELAGVLSHELAHNYAHHQARAVLQKYYLQNIAAAAIQLVNPNSAATQIAARLAAVITIDLFSRAYSRSEEKEADLLGSHLMFNAGYNPTALSGFFLKMYKANPKQPLKFLSTHPPAPDRASYLTDYLEAFPLDREMQVDSKDFQKMKARLATLLPQTQPVGPGRGILPKP